MYTLHLDRTTIQQDGAKTIHDIRPRQRAPIESKSGFEGICPFCRPKSFCLLSEIELSNGTRPVPPSSILVEFETPQTSYPHTETIPEPHAQGHTLNRCGSRLM